MVPLSGACGSDSNPLPNIGMMFFFFYLNMFKSVFECVRNDNERFKIEFSINFEKVLRGVIKG